MKQDPPKLDYASPRPRESEEPREKSELQQALSFVGVMFIGVGVVGFLKGLRHGPNLLALFVGVLGLAMYVCSRVVR